ncbi:MAG: uroporphyrinogen-III C-methyltransferase [Omnitrophica WOR_2 bacterium RIFCSPLOWO2_12_FULL_51_8]|nr:MAG: uroporphyrinogen-III C-methyltransferase [Omnitrophica WOR_2 bacterium RIFCSPLOWO2_12_FULL_51_8]
MPAHRSTVYLVGAGPGDCSLMTVKGLELIKTADCIIYDNLANPDLLKFRSNDCRLIYAGKKSGAHALQQEEINQLLAVRAKINRRIVRLKGGDPFIFGRGAEEALYLKRKNINFEIVPGISSAIAVPAYAGIPLTARGITSAAGFIAGHEDAAKTKSSLDWNALAKALGTMVFLMGAGNLRLIVHKLLACGKPRSTPVALISRGTTAGQKTVTGTLAGIVALAGKNKIRAPAVIVVGEVVRLRKALNWFEKKPLFGKRVMVIRASHQAGALSAKLMALGAEAIEIPVIKIVSLRPDRQLSAALSRRKYDWIIFTSQNGVSEFTAFLLRAGKDSRIFAGVKICCIGPETARRLAEIGIKADYVPRHYFAEAIVRHFRNPEFKGSRILILRARQARDCLPRGLCRAGLTVKAVDLYDTRIEQESALSLKEELKEGIDLVTFTSSSTVKNFVKLTGSDYRRRLAGAKIACIGPITSAALKEFGLQADIEAKVFTVNGLVEAVAGYHWGRPEKRMLDG